MCKKCARSAKLKIAVPEYMCFENWRDRANAMEAVIKAEDFTRSMKTHRVKYNKLAEDGDSRIMKKYIKETLVA